MIRILHTLPALDGGGAEKIIYDYCMRLLDHFEFDFIVHTDYKGILEGELEKRGCKVFHIAPLHKNFIDYIRKINSIIAVGRYDIIHVSQGYKGVFFLWAANRYNVKVRIAHSHMAYIPETPYDMLKRYITTWIAKYYATELFACGQDAAKWMWGNSKSYIMNNAIDINAFKFDECLRTKLRKQFGVEDKFVIGNVARFSYQKNHEYLIKIFKEVTKVNDNAILFLVGRGELYDKVYKQVVEAGLVDKVMFLGVRKDVPELLNVMDVFLLPSRYEGLPVTIVEVQANGLPALVSDSITKEICVNGNVKFLPIANNEIKEWVQSIKSAYRVKDNIIAGTTYDIEIAAKQLAEKYNNFLIYSN